MQVNSVDCGYIPPPIKGTILGTKCEGVDEVTNYADGIGGSFDVITTVKSAKCGYVAPTTRAPVVHPAAGTVLRTKCGTSATGNSYTKFNVVANGVGGTTDEQIAMNSPDCGYTPESVRGGVISVSNNITPPGSSGGGSGNNFPARGTVLRWVCAGLNYSVKVNIVANGTGGEYGETVGYSSDCPGR